MRWAHVRANTIKKFSQEELANIELFEGQAFFGRLLCLSRGQVVPVHKHEHKDECFDVVEGNGTLLVDGRELAGEPGTTLFVPAGVEHGLRADGTDQWLVRETVSERVYARRALTMVLRAGLKRLPLVGARWQNAQ